MNSIKKLAIAVVAIFAFQSAFAQSVDWKEMKTFHSVMSKTFHPSEEGNLKPVKENSADLLTKAKEWQASAVPEGLNKEETAKNLSSLVAKCEELNAAVLAGKTDDELKKLISEAHDIFHMVAEKCHKPEGEGKDEHKHDKKKEKKDKKKKKD